jgi:CO/xanthine dehydrogenase FAD-binding subunit
MRWRGYRIANSLEDALVLLAQWPGRAQVVAGGTDLMVQLKDQAAGEQDLHLVDINHLDELKGIDFKEDGLVIGATTTMAEIERSGVVHHKAPALVQGAAWVGSPQIRNIATIGGNVVNALPAADTAVPLVALGARAKISSSEGERVVPVEDLFEGVGKSKVDPGREILTHFIIPVSGDGRSFSALQRLAKRKAFTLPQLLAAVRLDLDRAGEKIESARIVVAPVAPVPWRAREAEKSMVGRRCRPENLERAAELARQEANTRTSIRAGAAYRKEMIKVLVRRALDQALEPFIRGGAGR